MAGRLVLARDIEPGMTVLVPKRALNLATAPGGGKLQPNAEGKVPLTVEGAFRDVGGVLLVGRVPGSYKDWPAELVTFRTAMTMEPYKVVES